MVVLENRNVGEDLLRSLCVGNTKLGEAIFSFSLPAVDTCPGSTAHCRRHCYARSGLFHMPSIQERYMKNWEAVQDPRFAELMVQAIRLKGISVLRVHVSGDFFSASYTAAWGQIATRLRNVRFFSYTRSWRDPEILTEIEKLALLPNWRMWLSEDRETGPAPKSPSTRRAYMCIDPLDELVAPSDVDLVFRDSPKSVLKKMNGVQVCPVEAGINFKTKMTCARCGICWRK